MVELIDGEIAPQFGSHLTDYTVLMHPANASSASPITPSGSAQFSYPSFSWTFLGLP
jgi:hypothetical protein